MAENQRRGTETLREIPLFRSITEAPRTIIADEAGVRQWLSARQMSAPQSMTIRDFSAERSVISRFYSGTAMGKAFDAAPPIVVSMSRADFLSTFRPAPTVDGQTPEAIYVPGTNMIVVSDEALSRYRPEVASEMIYHEMIHYAAFIGRGQDAFTFMGQSSFGAGRVPITIEAHWLEEGLTNLFASRLGHAQAMTYPFETMAVRMLEMLGADAAMLIEAHSGDTRRLQEIVDRRLGDGAFEGLLHCHNGIEAMAYLLGRDNQGAVFSRQAIANDPLMREFQNPGPVLQQPSNRRGRARPLERPGSRS
ncbi:MAG TPA: hypothetical protein VLD37_02775 [Candidatus Bilamarchaeum sp.]|nr:hypothetical protein [Candidatus Bilamarchaeum sp.]